MVEKMFKVEEAGSSIQTELIAGLTTFLTMAYIIFLNPAIISGGLFGASTGLSFDAAMLATCVAAAIATLVMGLLANYPIAQAPGMGENFLFFTVVTALAASGVVDAWRVALGIVFIAGVIFLVLSLVKFRKIIIDAVSPSMKNGIAVGIGLFIAFIGLNNSGVILISETGVQFNDNILSTDILIFFFGLIVTGSLFTRRIRGAIVIGIFLTLFLSLIVGVEKVHYRGIIGLPKDTAFLKFDLIRAMSLKFVPYIVAFLFLDMFDTAGTLIGVAEQAGFVKNNELPRANQALVSDAVGTVAGAALGTSTVTSFIESAAGVESGGRTGLTSVTVAVLFLAAVLFSPLAAMIGNYSPITSPALVIVGAMMVKNIFKIKWDDFSEVLPSFLIILGIPLSYNIADGMAVGFISYPIIKLLAGKHRDVHWFMYIVALIFILRYAFVSI